MAVLETRVEQIAFIISLFPAVVLFCYYFFVAKSDREKMQKSYHISGEWGIRFLWFSLAILPIYDFTQMDAILPLRIIFGIMSEIYVGIHSMTYLTFTLSKDGFTTNALIKQIRTRDYLIWGMIASAIGMVSMATFNQYLPIGGMLFASIHIMKRNWDRLNKGKSAVEGAAAVPYITGVLFIYQVYSLIFANK